MLRLTALCRQKDFENAVLVICGEGYRNRDPRDYHDDHIAASFSELAAKQPEEYSNLCASHSAILNMADDVGTACNIFA